MVTHFPTPPTNKSMNYNNPLHFYMLIRVGRERGEESSVISPEKSRLKAIHVKSIQQLDFICFILIGVVF